MGAASSSQHQSADSVAGGGTTSRGNSLGNQLTRWRVDSKSKDLAGYLPLYKAALEGNWEEAQTFFDDDVEALTAKITVASETTLQIAVGTGNAIHFVEKLVRRMSPEELAICDHNGETALSIAATVGNIEAAMILVNKNPDLPNLASKSGLPIHRAAQYGHGDMVKYLMTVTRDEVEPSPFSGQYGIKLLNSTIVSGLYDITLELIDKYPYLTTMEENGVGSPFSLLAQMPNAFPSGYNPSFWEEFPHLRGYFKGKKKAKLTHQHALKLVKCMCRETADLDDARAGSMFQKPLLLAAKLGIHEIIEEILNVFPPAIWSFDEENRNVFQVAVWYRRENVFNLLYQMSSYRFLVLRHIDPEGNNILHLAGQLPHSDRLNLVSGAALQMQRELQWYKEVETFVQPAYKMSKNNEGKTPGIVFSETHKDLIKDGEKWMKETATSCTVVAALIATVVFAAAITVPGGSDQNYGFPLFIGDDMHQQGPFAVFGVFDAISLFSSVASILMFLSILTSRYSESDFLRALPKRLVIGLICLFIAIASLMIASTAAIYLVFGQKKLWRLGLVCALANLTVILFMFPQFPLLVDMIRSTFGRGIFGKKSDRVLH